jgi:hypothetical protein
MPGTINDPWTLAVTFLELLFEDQVLATGSGFFWQKGDASYLVTNWHNFSGRDPISKIPLSESAALPDRVRFLEYEKGETEPDDILFQINVRQITLPLFADYPFQSLWYEHPIHGSAVDVAVLPISSEILSPKTLITSAQSLESDCIKPPFVTQDVYVIGYPLGIISGLPVPIWKRATIASEPLVDPEGLPKVFIDTATRKGMSGSVAITQTFQVGPYPKKDGSDSNTLMAITREILGVYSGRIGASAIEAQLGIVWKTHVIDEIISGAMTLDNN